jgi:CheY-like chemotaxis protein
VLEAGSGHAALEHCGSDTPVDALITDINLSDGATGWDVAWAFWRRDAIPVIYTSANSDLPDRRVPQSRFLAKPSLSSALIEECVHLHARFRQRSLPLEQEPQEVSRVHGLDLRAQAFHGIAMDTREQTAVAPLRKRPPFGGKRSPQDHAL